MERQRLAWQIIDSTKVADCRIFTVNRNICLSPTTGKQHDFYVLRCSNWVNVIPITSNQEVVLIEQYRHGTDTVTLEIPGGLVDPTDKSSEEAGARELLEETGYQAEKLVLIGSSHPNPAIQGNICDFYLAPNVKQVQEQKLDPLEQIHLRLIPYDQIPELIRAGTISHALVIVAFYYLSLYKTIK